MDGYNKWRKKRLGIFVLAAILGLVSVTVPPLLNTGTKYYNSPLFPWVVTGIENLSLSTIGFLFLSGMLLGLLCPEHPWLLGLGTMALFPILSLIEMVVDSSSHNLLPFELFLYMFMTVPGIIGAYIGSFLKRRFVKSNNA